MERTSSEAGDTVASLPPDGTSPVARTSQGSHDDEHNSNRPPASHRMSNVSGSSVQYPNHTAVELDHFDPMGMKQLKRTIVDKSNQEHRASTSNSDITLSGLEVGDGPFDLDKYLRNVMKQ